MKTLVIVESPNKISSIKKYLGDDYIVKSSVGHIVYLPSSGDHRFGVDMNTWIPNYKIDPKKTKVVRELRSELKNVKNVLIATDPDREGEAIGENLVHFLKIKNKYQRIRFNEITKEAILRAIDNATMIDENLVNSQMARRILDRIIGYKLSSLMKTKINNSPTFPSAGRVQSIALKKVVEREMEIEKFIPIKFITVQAQINENTYAQLVNGNYQDHKDWINPQEIENFRKDFKGSLKVVKVSTSKRLDARITPFKQSSLYKRADSKLGLSASAAQRAAQRLYEGYGEGGLISYPRTDSTRMSSGFITKAKSYLKNKFGDNFVEDKIKGSSGAQDAHEAIRPTDPTLTPEKAQAFFNLNSQESKLYKLIYNQAMMAIMKPAQREILRYDLSEGQNNFKISSSKVIFEGYLKIIGYEKSKELPVYKENEVIDVKDYLVEESETKPPARYNDGSLIEMLDSIGVGRPSTFATTVNILKNRMYVDIEGRALKATEFGKLVLQKLLEAFPKIINEKYTANMELQLDEISQGEVDYKKLLLDFWVYFEKEWQTATQTLPLTKLSVILANKDCPKCENPLIVRINKKDLTRFFACSTFPECRYTESDPTQKRKFFRRKK